MLKSRANVGTEGNEQLVKESFEVKAVTYLMATPDEICSAITDPLQRPLWDPSI